MVLTRVLGAPGVIYVPDLPSATLAGVPMDVTGFVGVAPRGPAWEAVDPSAWPVREGIARMRSVPVMVESWDDYVEWFGSFEGPGLLPYAIASFFQQGGRRAYVVRIVHDWPGVSSGGPPPGRSRYELSGGPSGLGGQPVVIEARSEGAWGDRLAISLSFATVPVAVKRSEPSALVLESQSQVVAGDYLRIVLTDGTRLLRAVNSVILRGEINARTHSRVALLDGPVTGQVGTVDRVNGVLDVADRDPARTQRAGRSERFEGLGLLPGHPDWLGDVLSSHSRLIELVQGAEGILLTDADLRPSTGILKVPGQDLYPNIVPQDIFGTLLEGDDSATEGLDVLLRAPEVTSIVVPDLYSPAPVPPDVSVFDEPPLGAAEFTTCPPHQPDQAASVAPPGLDGLRLDPTDPYDLARIIDLQLTAVRYAEEVDAVVLLDVPPRLRQRAVLSWRSRFDSSHAAGYHPWLRVPSAEGSRRLVELNPSAAAAGIIARTALAFGVSHGPANEPAIGAVDVTDRLEQAAHDELHQAGVDVFRMHPDGAWLTGARTLAADRTWRQLSVRRLLSLLERSIRQELQWTVFEPNDRGLRSKLVLLLGGLLARLFAQGAFAGATPAESYFVRTAGDLDLSREVDAGQLRCEIGVAPAEPLEFIIVRIARDAQGAFMTETLRG